MNKAEKQAAAESLRSEATVIRQTRENYKEARANIEEKIRVLSERTQTQSVIWQRQYQEALKGQLDTAIDALSTKNYSSIRQYLSGEYENGFLGTMYSLQKQGIPLVMPIDQRRVVKMIETTGDKMKLSKKLYGNAAKLKNAVRREISIGLASGESYQAIAGRLTRTMGVDYNKTVRIARTEGGRVQNSSRFDAMTGAKANGADIVKQWDSTLDNRTRTAHRELDGQIAELEDKFKYGKLEADHPHGFGVAWMDVNCRCVIVQRARWAVEDPEFEDYTKFSRFDDFDREAWIEGKLKEQVRKKGGNASIIDLSDAKNFSDFKARYKIASNNLVAQTAASEIGVEVMGEDAMISQEAAEVKAPRNAPERPRKADFDSEEAYERARKAYRAEREAYEEQRERFIKHHLEKPKTYDTPEAVADWAKRNNIRIPKEVLDGVDPRVWDDIIKTYDDLLKRFPDVKRYYEAVGSKFGIYFDDVGGLGAPFMQGNSGLTLNKRIFKDYREVLETVADNLKEKGFQVYGDGTFKTSLTHEFGHNLDAVIRQKRFYGGLEKGYDPNFDVDYSAVRKYENDLMNMAKKYGSEYSKTNTDEAFAEGFAAYIKEPKSKFGKAFGKFLAKWM